MPICRRHKKENCTKEIPSSNPKKMGTKNRLETSKCPIEEITCKIDLGKPELSLFGFKTHNME
jgi:hypothetical protein